jgi:hypothetical protein
LTLSVGARISGEGVISTNAGDLHRYTEEFSMKKKAKKEEKATKKGK